MNNGVANEATRCFRRLFDGFASRVRQLNPDLPISFKHVQPRNLGELPDESQDLILSSGGPGSPYDGYEDPWCVGYRKFVDTVVERNHKDRAGAPGLFVVCHSYEITVAHFGVAKMLPRHQLKFGVMPAYITEQGTRSVMFQPFGDRIFTWEHRRYEAVDLDEKKLKGMGGQLLAVESRPGGNVDKGRGLIGFDFTPGVVGTQFHPEADRMGVLAWINRPEHAAAFKDAYGNSLYERMMQTLADPNRLGRTFALVIPGWLTSRFNQLAQVRGYKPIPAPEMDMREFEENRPLANAV